MRSCRLGCKLSNGHGRKEVAQWTTITHRHLLNFLVYSSMGTVFIKSVDATDYIQDAKYINKLLNEVIEEVGADCAVQVVTDNAANMKAAGMMLMKQRPRIFWSPCAAHCLDLMLEVVKGKVMQQVIDGHVSNEIRLGLKNVIERLAESTDEAIWATNQIDIYNVRAGSFGTTTARRAITQTYPAEWWLNYGDSAPALRTIAIKVLSQTTSSSNCERNWSAFSFIHTRLRNRLTMQKFNKLVYIHYNLKLWSRNRRRRQFEDHRDYFCPINLDYIFSEEDTVLGQWLEEQEQLGRAPDTSKPRGKEVDEESESSISTSSSSAGIPPDSPGDEGYYRDDGAVTYEIVEHFPDATELDPRCGYVRHVGQKEAGGSSSAVTHGSHWSYVGQGAMYGQHEGYVGQQGAMYGQHESYSCDPNWVTPFTSTAYVY
ncbi:Copia protein [Cinnamomum micranthum f. kanehirae]|uniref:Copia protein n=1 Tax=Cinnamomum micranthum f. kanehirae TaxID=337451 RepID=A0A3S4N5F2_9MAGN|nr:Copia protein [Cinnamomum micranthum f. kanehirae]